MTSPEGLSEIPIGELNNMAFRSDDPLVTNEYNGKSLLSGLMGKFLERINIFDNKRPHKGVVLLSAKVQMAGVDLQSILPPWATTAWSFLSGDDNGNFRNFAIVRVPEVHGHLPTPNMQTIEAHAGQIYSPIADQRDDGRAQLPDQEKLLLSMHDGYFSAPINDSDMPWLKPGDIVLLDGDGLIIQLVEPSAVGFWTRAGRLGARALYRVGLPGAAEYIGDLVDPQKCDEPRTALDILHAYGPAVGPAFMDWEIAQKIVTVAEGLGMEDPGWLANVIYYETAYTFDPKKTNNIGATGLIQFTNTTAANLGTTTEALRRMNSLEQLDWVKKYFEYVGGTGLTTQADVFAAVFFPAAVGKGPDFSVYDWYVQNHPRGVEKANEVRDDNNGIIYMGDYTNRALSSARLKCPEDER